MLNQNDLKAKLREDSLLWFNLACQEFNIDASKYNITVIFDLRGATGGTALKLGESCTLNYNMTLAMDNQDEYINVIIPHEVAHLITDIIYGVIIRGYRKGKAIQDSHGREWQYVMRRLGQKPNRCHKMDVSKVKTRLTRPYVYTCSNCHHEYKITKNRHAKFNGRVVGCVYCKTQSVTFSYQITK